MVLCSAEELPGEDGAGRVDSRAAEMCACAVCGVRVRCVYKGDKVSETVRVRVRTRVSCLWGEQLCETRMW